MATRYAVPVADTNLRELERRFSAPGCAEDEVAWLRARVQAGELEQSKPELAAYCGHEGAGFALQDGAPPVPSTINRLIHGLRAWPGAASRAALAVAYVVVEGHALEGAQEALNACSRLLLDRSERTRDRAERACEPFVTEYLTDPPSLEKVMRVVVKATRSVRHQSVPQAAYAANAAEELLAPEEIRSLVLAELVPWALGYSDPVRERVEARQREAAGG